MTLSIYILRTWFRIIETSYKLQVHHLKLPMSHGHHTQVSRTNGKVIVTCQHHISVFCKRLSTALVLIMCSRHNVSGMSLLVAPKHHYLSASPSNISAYVHNSVSFLRPFQLLKLILVHMHIVGLD